MKDLWYDKILKVNLISSCFVWLLSSFNFYLITFYLKKFPGSIYINSIVFAFADMVAFASSGLILKYFLISQGLSFSYGLSLISGILYLIFHDMEEQFPWLIPVLVCFCRVGGSMSFNIGYISVARLFPTRFVATVFGIVNFVSHSVTVGAPMVAELPEPIPFFVFCANAFLAIFACLQLIELDRAKKIAQKLRERQQNERLKNFISGPEVKSQNNIF